MHSNVWRTAAAAAFALLIIAAGAYLFGRAPGGTGGPGPIPSPSPSPQPYPTSGLVAPGTYLVRPPDAPAYTVTMPADWQAGGEPVKNDGTPASLALMTWRVGNVSADPCQWVGNLLNPPVGPTVDDLATALANQPRRSATTPMDVSLGGYSGKYLELTVPIDLDFATCSQDPGQGPTSPHFFVSWVGLTTDETMGFARPGSHDRIWILDVNGVRLLLDAVDFPAATAQDRGELQSIIDSIHIEPMAPTPSPSTSP